MDDQHIETPGCCCNKNKDNAGDAITVSAEKDVVQPASGTKKTIKAISSVVLSVLIAFFPKCPVCWAVYMSMFGSLGLAQLPYLGWLLPVLMSFLFLHVFMQYKRSAKNGYLPFLLSLAGAGTLIIARIYFSGEKWLLLTAMSFIISGSLLNSLSDIKFQLFTHKQTNN